MAAGTDIVKNSRDGRAGAGARLLAGLVAAIGLIGCASAEAPRPSAGDIEVVNASPLAITVVIDGRAELSVPPDSRRLARHVPNGVRRIGALAGDGRGGLLGAETVVDVIGGETVVWVHGADGREGRALPPALAALVVESAVGYPVRLTLDGHPQGWLLPGERRDLRGLAPGAVLAEALADGVVATARLELEPGGVGAWVVGAEGRRVRVENATDEAIFIEASGKEAGRIGPGESGELRLEPTLHALVATSEPSRRRYELELDLRGDAGAEAPVWRVTSGSATAVIENRTGEAVAVEAAGVARGVLGPEASMTIAELPDGAVDVRAVTEAGRVHATTLHLAAGDKATWRLVPMTAAIRVVNQGPHAVAVGAGLEGQPLSPRGTAAPGGGSLLLTDLTPGLWQLEATDPIGQTLVATTIEVTESSTTTWQVRPGTGSLRITNRRREAVSLAVDGGDLGRLLPGETRVATPVAPGPHRVDGTGAVSGVGLSQVVRVASDETADVVFGDAIGTVLVRNLTGEEVAPLGPLGTQRDRIGVGAEAEFILSPGVQSLRFAGQASSVVHEKEVVLEAGVAVAVELSNAPAELVLTSQLPEAVAVSRQGRVLGVVEPDATESFSGLVAGRVELQLVGMGSGRFRTVRAQLSPGRRAHMTVSPIPAVLLVENTAPEPVSVYLGATLLGEVPAGARLGFGRLAAGALPLRFVFARSRQLLALDVAVDEGEKRHVIVEAPRGSVLI